MREKINNLFDPNKWIADADNPYYDLTDIVTALGILADEIDKINTKILLLSLNNRTL